MEPGEYLILSYGLGVYRITCVSDLNPEHELFKSLQITNFHKVEDHYIGLSDIGLEPSLYEISMQETSEYKDDEIDIIKNGPQCFKDRFYQLHLRFR